MSLQPNVQGSCAIRTTAPEFFEGVKRRVAAGFLSGRPHFRSNYVVTNAERASLHIRAADWPTALNVGLNEVDLQMPESGRVRYRIRYWRWASYCVGLGAALGIFGMTLLLAFDVRSYVVDHPAGMIRGLSPDQNVAVAWGMVVFWGFLWPWILIHFHQVPLRRLIERLIQEIDASGAGNAHA
jgi:hypothetical protein